MSGQLERVFTAAEIGAARDLAVSNVERIAAERGWDVQTEKERHSVKNIIAIIKAQASHVISREFFTTPQILSFFLNSSQSFQPYFAAARERGDDEGIKSLERNSRELSIALTQFCDALGIGEQYQAACAAQNDHGNAAHIFTKTEIHAAAETAIKKLNGPDYREYFRETHDLARMETSISDLLCHLIEKRCFTVQTAATELTTELRENIARIRECRGNTSEAEQEIREAGIISTQMAEALGIRQQFELAKIELARSAPAVDSSPGRP